MPSQQKIFSLKTSPIRQRHTGKMRRHVVAGSTELARQIAVTVAERQFDERLVGLQSPASDADAVGQNAVREGRIEHRGKVGPLSGETQFTKTLPRAVRQLRFESRHVNTGGKVALNDKA